jgi:CheY-like chemotaxis protein
MKRLSCILLVDDDKTTNFVNQLLLQDLDVAHLILSANSGFEALDIINNQCQKNGCLQLIFLDINMPGMDGFEFLEAYDQMDFPNKDSIKVVMLTTSSNPKDINRLENMPIADFLNKPLTEEKVLELIQKHF